MEALSLPDPEDGVVAYRAAEGRPKLQQEAQAAAAAAALAATAAQHAVQVSMNVVQQE